MRGLFWIAALVALLVVAIFPPAETPAQIRGFSSGDTTLTAASTFSIFPCFSDGGGHIHDETFYLVANGCGPASGGYVYTSASSLRLIFHSSLATVDSTGFTLPSGATFNMVPVCDSITVLNTGNASTTVTWGVWQ